MLDMDDKPDETIAELEGEELGSTVTPVSGTTISPGDSSKSEPSRQPEDNHKPSKTSGNSLLARAKNWKNIYLTVFGALVLLAGLSVIGALMWGRDSSKDSEAQQLTTEQLAELAGNTTIVGDSKQTLSIQSSTVFEGQVLARNDLSVAGSLSVGGALSLPSIDAGSGTFDQLQVDNSLSVAGNLNLQGSLTVSGSTSFKTLSASQLNVSNLQLTGDLSISRHIVPSGGNPGKSNGSALGSGGTVSVSGSDTAGTVTINTGSSPPAGCFVTVNFVNKFNTTPRVVVSPSNSSSASLDYYTNRSTTNFSLCTINAPSAGTTYIFDYIAFD